MIKFNYKAINAEGRTVSGVVESPSEDLGIDTLKDKGYRIIYFREDKGDFVKMFTQARGSVKSKDLVIFSRQFAVMVSANVSIVQALKVLSFQADNPIFKNIVKEIADEVDGGSKLSTALEKRSKVFSVFYINVVRSGETSGKLNEVLDYLADELEKDYDLNAKIKGAMIYPLIITIVMIAASIFVLVVIIPSLTEVLLEQGGKLPIFTRLLVGLSDFMRSFWYIIVVAFLLLVGGYKYANTKPESKRKIDEMKLKLPVFGMLLQKIYIVRFARSLQTLMVGGVNLSKGLEITSRIVDNLIYKELIEETKKDVEDGNSITDAFSKSEYVPSMVSQMMKIGEKTGKLDVILANVSNFYTREINNIVANLVTLMEPFIILVLGAGVVWIVLAVMVPMLQMSSNYH